MAERVTVYTCLQLLRRVADMDHVAEVLLALGVIALAGILSFAIILLVYRLCCDVKRRGRLGIATSAPRDDADRMLLGSSTPRISRTDVKQLKRSAVRNDGRGVGLYAGVKSIRQVQSVTPAWLQQNLDCQFHSKVNPKLT